MDADHLRGHLGTMVLAVLASGRAHGYGIAVGLKDRSGGALEILEGSLYPALHRLEAEGLVSSGWETSNGRRRRSYELTDEGRAQLSDRAQAWRRFRSFMDSLLEEADG